MFNKTPYSRRLTTLVAVTVTGAVITWLCHHYGMDVFATIALVGSLFSAYCLSLQWRIVAARGRARQAMDRLRAELDRAENSRGDDYAWVRHALDRTGFDYYVREVTVLTRGLEMRSDALDRQLAPRKLWDRVGLHVTAWDEIAGATISPIQALTDSIWWTSGGAQMITYDASHFGKPRIVLPTPKTHA